MAEKTETKDAPAPSPSSSSSSLLPFRLNLLFAESDPSLEEHTLIIIPTTDLSDTWIKDAAAQFDLCGVCRERAPSTLRVSAPFEVHLSDALRLNSRINRVLTTLSDHCDLTIDFLSGFVCCTDPACTAISQLRADTRIDGIKSGGKTKKLSTPHTVLKACSYCARSREMVPTRCCGRCRAVRYCGESCQRLHWPFHKKLCARADTERKQ